MVAINYAGQLRDFERWSDIDFDSEALRTGNFTGCLPRRSSLGAERRVLEDVFGDEIITREQLPDVIAAKDANKSWMTELITRIFDQNGEGACVTDAIGQCHETVQCKMVGPNRVIPVSAMSIYRWIAGGPQTGSNLDDALEQLQKVGILPWDGDARNKQLFKHYHPNTGWSAKFMDGWKDTAKLLTAAEQLDVRTAEGFWTALCKGWPVMYARRGHCICGQRLFMVGKTLKLGYVNSWGQWGDVVNDLFNYGMGYDSESDIRNCAYGAIAFRQVHTPMTDPNFAIAI